MQLLKKDPASVKDYPFKGFCQRSIERLDQAAKLEPQDATNALGLVEESKLDNQRPQLVSMVLSYVEINEVV